MRARLIKREDKDRWVLMQQFKNGFGYINVTKSIFKLLHQNSTIFVLHKGIEHNRFCYTNASNICYMKTFQTMDCVFNEIILCNWVWHWDVKAMQKFRDFFPTPFAKQRFWFPHRNPNWDLEPTHNSPPLLCCPVLSWWAEDSTAKWPNMAWNSETVDPGPNYGDSVCLELKAGWASGKGSD